MEAFTDCPPVPEHLAAVLNTMGSNIRVCGELLQQTKDSLDKVETLLSHQPRSVPDLSKLPEPVGPPSERYRLFRDLPEDCEWARNFERQLQTHDYTPLPEEDLKALNSYLTGGPSRNQSTEGPQEESTEGSTLYLSALDQLTPSGAQMNIAGRLLKRPIMS